MEAGEKKQAVDRGFSLLESLQYSSLLAMTT